MYAATLSLEVQGAVAKAVEGALAVEAGEGLPRVSTQLERIDDDLNIYLRSEDLPSLRAGINSFLRWASMAAEVAQGADTLNDNTYDHPAHQGR
jgi:tRNA threonylcarbamoyladenosine modification (KEOPS) complex  Pcc1 subunit